MQLADRQEKENKQVQEVGGKRAGGSQGWEAVASKHS